MDTLIYAILIVVLAVYVVGTVWERNECETRGGTMVPDGFFYVWHTTDYRTGAGYLNPVPKYRCDVPK